MSFASSPKKSSSSSLRPGAQGLYLPEFEHDACGVGFVCRMDGARSHRIIGDALRILENLAHRGATGADARTGDGAGLLSQIPHEFFATVSDFQMPEPDAYGAGLVFLPKDPESRRRFEELFEAVIREEGQRLLGWRTVPVREECLGDTARRVAPFIRQIFIARSAGLLDDRHFERKLYVIRKRMEKAMLESEDPGRSFFYVPSLSNRTLVYKGLFLADQITPFFPDLSEPTFRSALAMVHQRYSTNTFPTWDLAQPFRFLCHNGEINTLRGNINWMNAREGLFRSPRFGDDLQKILPVLTPGASDSATLDNALELLWHTGRSLPHAMSMLIPEAWENHPALSDDHRAFCEYNACVMEPWDGPAAIPFTDGRCVGAVLDRNGLRPSRYTVTRDGVVSLASEIGVLDIEPENILIQGRLEPGRMLLVDLDEKRIVGDDEIKQTLAARRPYRAWINSRLRRLRDLPPPGIQPSLPSEDRRLAQRAFGYTQEDVNLLIEPMAATGDEPVGSMGTDTPLAVLSDKPQLLYSYFHQLFAQVTNPPLDAIREELVTSMMSYLGGQGDLFHERPEDCRRFRIDHPILTGEDMEKIRRLTEDPFRAAALPMLYPVAEGAAGLEQALENLFEEASRAVENGCGILILSDHGLTSDQAPIPALLAVSGLHHHLILRLQRTRAGLILDSGEPRETHHFAALFGFGADAIHPFLALETVRAAAREGRLEEKDETAAVDRFNKAALKGVLKVMSKMGISTLRSYRGAQIFEAVGLGEELIHRYFTHTPSRIGGIGLEEVAWESARRHERAFPVGPRPAETLDLDVGGDYQWRRNGSPHLLDPLAIAKLQQAVRTGDAAAYQAFAERINRRAEQICTLRGLLDFQPAESVPLDEVEPWTDIVRRFKTGAMSYGSISREAHETLAIAMNRMGARSNSGEGGEDADRYGPDPGGLWRRSSIKQVASGRFGVTSHYLVNAQELQIKIAQGAKPGEGGQLPGYKVYPWIARTRHSTPYVTLISPPPHHDIYSIEDLSQLIHDLKNANPRARVDVKLVAEVGVGTVAAGVAKGKADLVLISGFDGGTGASPLSSIKHAGLPWELGLSETQQTLVLNNLRDRITVECDGKLLTGRDVAVACLLGAEEFGFSAGPVVSMGCIMMRVCHLNTCPVGVATQDPELRKRFTGKPEHIIQYFQFVAEELRGIMAQLGFRKLDDMVGRSDRLKPAKNAGNAKTRRLDLARILCRPEGSAGGRRRESARERHGLDRALDQELIARCEPALERGEKVELDLPIRNIHRTVGTLLSSRVSANYGEEGLPDGTIVIHARGSAGQSFGAFGARGITFEVEGDANDYLGKGLSGAKIILFPPRRATFKAEENVLIGNVALYGATSGEVYIRGRAGERFAVRNSGAVAVVEGVGDHGCEYMTGGRVILLGSTGRNFAAGMSGGIAYVYDESGEFGRTLCNRDMVELEPLADPRETAEVRERIETHRRLTGSPVADLILQCWDQSVSRFVKVMPTDYKRALALPDDASSLPPG